MWQLLFVQPLIFPPYLFVKTIFRNVYITFLNNADSQSRACYPYFPSEDVETKRNGLIQTKIDNQ